MARLLKKAGDFVLDIAAQQYKRSMTRKLNAFGEDDDRRCFFFWCRSRCSRTKPITQAALARARRGAAAAVERKNPVRSRWLIAHQKRRGEISSATLCARVV